VRALGAGGLTAVTIAGQLGVAVLTDHFGCITVAEIAGVALLARGTRLIIRD
jgi:uncharacterized membrane protein YdcZ (DUF606 family)